MAAFPDELMVCTGFQWDSGNAEKNRDRHQVTQSETEQLFFNRPILVAPDLNHSLVEPRFAILGHQLWQKAYIGIHDSRDFDSNHLSPRYASSREDSL
jgi:uncharacterized DUF497 family protein